MSQESVRVITTTRAITGIIGTGVTIGAATIAAVITITTGIPIITAEAGFRMAEAVSRMGAEVSPMRRRAAELTAAGDMPAAVAVAVTIEA
jgi:hypothetical protein